MSYLLGKRLYFHSKKGTLIDCHSPGLACMVWSELLYKSVIWIKIIRKSSQSTFHIVWTKVGYFEAIKTSPFLKALDNKGYKNINLTTSNLLHKHIELHHFFLQSPTLKKSHKRLPWDHSCFSFIKVDQLNSTRDMGWAFIPVSL